MLQEEVARPNTRQQHSISPQTIDCESLPFKRINAPRRQREIPLRAGCAAVFGAGRRRLMHVLRRSIEGSFHIHSSSCVIFQTFLRHTSSQLILLPITAGGRCGITAFHRGSSRSMCAGFAPRWGAEAMGGIRISLRSSQPLLSLPEFRPVPLLSGASRLTNRNGPLLNESIICLAIYRRITPPNPWRRRAAALRVESDTRMHLRTSMMQHVHEYAT